MKEIASTTPFIIGCILMGIVVIIAIILVRFSRKHDDDIKSLRYEDNERNGTKDS